MIQQQKCRYIKLLFFSAILVVVVLVVENLPFCHSLSTTTTTKISIGERIQSSKTVSDLLDVGGDIWLPTDKDLPSHLRLQRVHHEKRLRWSSQILNRLGETYDCSDSIPDWNDDRFTRIILAAATPFEEDRPDKEGKYIKDALSGINNILGHQYQKNCCQVSSTQLDSITMMMERAENLASSLTLVDALEIRWACRGIVSRIDSNIMDNFCSCIPNLDARADGLPFDIIPNVINWEEISQNKDPIDELLHEIPFNFDTIVTRTGAKVTERRGTAWIAEDGIGALAYSGKLMPPQKMPNIVRTVMRKIEERVLLDDKKEGEFFDCALCNHYPDGDSACKFHTDPEHGSHWDRLTCVVSAGVPRRFAFRPIPGISQWNEWDCIDDCHNGSNNDPTTPAVAMLFPGDVVKMFNRCNDDFHHAVYPGQTNADRISLVLKRSIDRGGGNRGHGLSGQGRRSRRQAKQQNPANDLNFGEKTHRRMKSKRRGS